MSQRDLLSFFRPSTVVRHHSSRSSPSNNTIDETQDPDYAVDSGRNEGPSVNEPDASSSSEPEENLLSQSEGELSPASEVELSSSPETKRRNVGQKQRKPANRKFKQSWLTESNYKSWLQMASNGGAWCSICKISFVSEKHNLEKHRASEKHKDNVRAKANLDDVQPIDSSIKVMRSTRQQKIAEIKLAVFIAEHCSVTTVDHLGELISSIFPHVLVAQDIRLHRTKCSRLIASVISPSLLLELIEDTKDSYFSLLINESTDVGTLKMLCMVIRYFSFKGRKFVTTFYRLLCLEACDSDAISDVVVNCLRTDGLDTNRLMGIGTDNAAVMTGAHSSVYTKLRDLQPQLVLVRCVCHSLALAASKAAECLPTKLDFLIEQTYAWFARSTKRLSEFQEIYKLINDGEKPLNVSTRWLSRYECIKRILAQFDELKLYFQHAAQQERSYTVVQLAQIYNEKECRLFLVFLESILKLITDKNELFQSENANPLLLLDNLVQCYEMVLQKITVPGRFAQLTLGNMASFPFESYLRTPETMDVPYELNQMLSLSSLTAEEKKQFLYRCRTFMVELGVQLRNRLPESLQVLNLVRYLDPVKAMKSDSDFIKPLLHRFQNVMVDRDRASSEYGLLHKGTWEREVYSDPLAFWANVYNSEGDKDAGRFPNISIFALAVLSLPYSSAAVERVFSIMNVFKTRLRNRMQCTMLDSILRIRFGLIWRGESCHSFNVTDTMLAKFKNEMCTDDSSQLHNAGEDEVFDVLM